MTAEQHMRLVLDGTLTKFGADGVRTVKVPRDHLPTHQDGRLCNRHAGFPDLPDEGRRKPFRARLDDEERAQIIALRDQGKPVRAIARAVGRCAGTVGVWLSRLPK